MRAPDSITVRRPEISFPARLDPMLLEAQPELSYALVGISLIAPYVERYVIRTMNEAKQHVTDPEILRSIALFNSQEGQHYRLHMRFNEGVRHSCPALVEFEQELAADFQRFSRTRSLQWNLAYAEGFEAFTGALSSFLLEQQLLRGVHPDVRDLFEWHFVEELEHRCVAFDVYKHVCGGYAYRLAVGLYAQRHLGRFVARVARAMLEHDRANGRDHGGKVRSRARLRPFLSLAARRLLPKVLGTYLPRYTPYQLGMPAEAELVLQRLAAREAGRHPAPPSQIGSPPSATPSRTT